MNDTKQKITNKTANGKVFKCVKCSLIHIEFKNLNFNFTQLQYNHFANYILGLEGEKWEYLNRNTIYVRKIIIPIGHQNFNFILNNTELTEFKLLLSVYQSDAKRLQSVKVSQFDFQVQLN